MKLCERDINRLKKNQKDIRIELTDSLYAITHKSDTLFSEKEDMFSRYINLMHRIEYRWHGSIREYREHRDIRKYGDMSKVNSRNSYYFTRVAMFNDAGESKVTDELRDIFSEGISKIAMIHFPDFEQNRTDEKIFTAQLMEYNSDGLFDIESNNELTKVCSPLFDSIEEYAKKFAEDNNLERIIFYYLYD